MTKLLSLFIAAALLCTPAHAQTSKFSQIPPGGAFTPSTDSVVTLRSGFQDLLTTLGTAATKNTGVSGATCPLNNGGFTQSGTANFTGAFQISGTSQTFPSSGMLCGTSDTQTLTNKNISGSEINSGTISPSVLPKATSSTFGIMQPDNTSITITGGVISAVGGGGGSGTVSSGTIGNMAFYTGSTTVGSITNPAAITKISSGILVDPRNYGAACAGATWVSGNPVEVGTSDDTMGFELAEIASLQLGGHVLVPEGCWVDELLMFNGVTFDGGNMATNGGFEYGFGGIQQSLVLTPGTGYTNGTYPITTLTNPGSGTGFTTGANGGAFNFTMTSATSLTVGTGSKTFTFSTSPGSAQFIVNSWITLSQVGTPANYLFGQVTAISGTSVTFTVTQTGGSGTISSWNVYVPPIITVAGGSLSSFFINPYALGQNYQNNTTIPIPAGAGSGTGGAITIPPVRVNGQPWNGPVLYTKGNPNYTIDWNGAQGIAFTGFEIYCPNAQVACEGSNVSESGFGDKIYNFHMNFFGGNYNIYDPNAYDYLVTQDSVYSGSGIAALGGAFSDLYSRGDNFLSNNIGISGSGAGFARIEDDRFEYEACGICGTNFLEVSIVNTQFDHMATAAIQYQSGQDIYMTGGALKAGGLGGSFQVTGAAKCSANNDVCLTVNSDNGSCCGQSTATGWISNGLAITVKGVAGTTEANGNWTENVVDGSHIDLVGTTFTHTYTSGGYAGVAGFDADIEMEGTGTSSNSAIGLHMSNVQYADAAAVGGCCAPFSVLDMPNSATFNDYISFEGGMALPYGTPGVANNYVSYSGQFANFRVSNPAHYRQELVGQPRIITDDSTFSVNFSGDVGIGTNNAEAGASLDLGQRTDSLQLPVGSTSQRPSPAFVGEERWNNTLPGLEIYNGSTWVGAGAVNWPSSGSIVISNGTNTPAGLAESDGSCAVGISGVWATGPCSGTSNANLGTSISATSPQRSGQATTGLYSAASGEIDMAVVTAGQIGKYTAAGAVLTANGSNCLTVGPNGTTNPVLQTDCSTASVATGINLKGAATGGTTTLTAEDSGGNANLTITNVGNGNMVFGPGTGGGSAYIQAGSSTPGTAPFFQLNNGAGGFFEWATAAEGSSANPKYLWQPATGDFGLSTSTEAIMGHFWGAHAGTRTWNSGNLALQEDWLFDGATDDFLGVSTLGNAATLGVRLKSCGNSGNATCTNESGIYIPSAALTGTILNSYGINAAAASGATNNYAAQLIGPSVVGPLISTNTKFTTSGCSISSTTGGAAAGIFTLGAHSCTAIITINGATGATAPNGWSCQAHDQTAPTVLIGGESSSTQTTASIPIPAGAGTTDVISFSCTGY